MKKMLVVAKKAKNDLFFVWIRFFGHPSIKLARLPSLLATWPDFGGYLDRFSAHFGRIPANVHYPTTPVPCPVRGENGWKTGENGRKSHKMTKFEFFARKIEKIASRRGSNLAQGTQSSD